MSSIHGDTPHHKSFPNKEDTLESRKTAEPFNKLFGKQQILICVSGSILLDEKLCGHMILLYSAFI